MKKRAVEFGLLREATVLMTSTNTTRLSNLDADQLAAEFGQTASFDRLKEIAKQLARPGLTKKAGDSEHFRSGVQFVLKIAAQQSASERLEALALLWRLMTQPSKWIQQTILAGLRQSAPEICASSILPASPKDRDYLAQAVSISAIEGKDKFLASLAVSEGQVKTTARDSAIRGLVESTVSLSEAFDLLTSALKEQNVETIDKGKSRAIRTARILDAVRDALRATDPSVDASAGEALSRLLEQAVRGRDEISRTIMLDLTLSALDTLTAFVRPNFAIALDPRVFTSVQVLKRASIAEWSEETTKSREDLANIVRQTLFLLARAGTADNDLRKVLFDLLGKARAEAILREMASYEGLRADVRHWLETGRSLRVAADNSTSAETLLDMVDHDIADAFRESMQLRDGWVTVRDDIADAGLKPSVRSALPHISANIERLAKRMALIAGQRGLEIVEELGEAIQYSPVDHESDAPLIGSRVVRVVAPKVIRRLRTGSARVVLRSKVEPL